MSSLPSGTQVLVVDDDLISRSTLAGVLRHIPGVEVVQAPDGQAAWQMLEDGLRPQACCSDLGMPRLGGLELMDRVRAHPILNDLPVVLITGTADRETVLAAMQRGAAGYIVKPFVAADTLGTLQRVLRAAVLRHAEAPGATRMRLHQDTNTLGGLLQSLRDQASSAAEGIAPSPDDTAPQLQLESLRSACLTLGLWRAAELLGATPAGAADPATAQLVLREVARMAAHQLQRLGLPAEAAK